jgi:hypothetical protein
VVQVGEDGDQQGVGFDEPPSREEIIQAIVQHVRMPVPAYNW